MLTFSAGAYRERMIEKRTRTPSKESAHSIRPFIPVERPRGYPASSDLCSDSRDVAAIGQNSIMMDLNSFVWVSRKTIGALGSPILVGFGYSADRQQFPHFRYSGHQGAALSVATSYLCPPEPRPLPALSQDRASDFAAAFCGNSQKVKISFLIFFVSFWHD
jgi:hypothetical protein